MSAPTATAITPIIRPRRPSSCCNGVGTRSTVWVRWAMRPSSVPPAVATTMPRPTPLVTTVPAWSNDDRSESGVSASTGAGPLSTATDSPVSTASSAITAIPVTIRMSAGTRIPARISTMSPGTRVVASISPVRPSRSTRQCGLSIARRASIAFSARHSWTNPRMPFMTTMTAITAASVCSSAMIETTTAPPSTAISGLTNCRTSTSHQCSIVRASTSLGPYRSSRSAASCSDRP